MNTNIIEVYSNNNQANLWRNYIYDMDKGVDIAKYVARTKYAFPGGYELYAITDDGGVLCHDCCRSQFEYIVYSCGNDGWKVVAVDSTVNCDMEDLHCDHCSKLIYEYGS